MTATNVIEALSSEAYISNAPRLEPSSVEALPAVPTAPRSPRPKKSIVKENKLAAKEKNKKLEQFCAFQRNHTMTPTQKKDKQLVKHKQKVVDLEAKEAQRTEDIDAQGVEPITKLLGYIPLRNLPSPYPCYLSRFLLKVHGSRESRY